MNTLAQLEKLIERLIEGSFSWLFKPRFHAADLTRVLALEMEKGTVEAHGKRLAPSHYEIYLSTADFQALQEQTTLTEEIAAAKRYLTRLQAEMGYDGPTDPEINISPRSDISPGHIMVTPSALQQK